MTIQKSDDFARAAVPNLDGPFGALIDIAEHHVQDAPIDGGPQVPVAGIEIGLGCCRLAAIQQSS
ncbi:hypothetical protein AO062_28720 [Variovorax boronicumulans]|nr:hypothetical protein AO062_28720 [Variovorax boronicumulans]